MNSVYMDDALGGVIAASYLINKGANKLCYIGVDAIECSLRRQEGFVKEGKKNNIKDICIIFLHFIAQYTNIFLSLPTQISKHN